MIGSLFMYLVKVIGASGIGYCYYHFVLRNKSFHVFNRFYLLGVVIFSLLIPFISIPAVWQLPIHLQAHNTSNGPATLYSTSSNWRTIGVQRVEEILMSILFIVSLILLGSLFFKIRWIYRVRATGNITLHNGFAFIETNVSQAPFSFFSNLFWREGLPLDNVHSQKIFAHERAHIQQYHSYDKMFCQVITAVVWVNPFFWLVQKELSVVHEFLADKESIAAGDSASFAQMLLHAHNQGHYLNPAHAFFNSSIKRRLVMITSTSPSRFSMIRKLMGLPIVMIIALLIATAMNAQIDPSFDQVPVQVTKVNMATKWIRVTSADSLQSILQREHAEKLAAEKAALH